MCLYDRPITGNRMGSPYVKHVFVCIYTADITVAAV